MFATPETPDPRLTSLSIATYVSVATADFLTALRFAPRKLPRCSVRDQSERSVCNAWRCDWSDVEPGGNFRFALLQVRYSTVSQYSQVLFIGIFQHIDFTYIILSVSYRYLVANVNTDNVLVKYNLNLSVFTYIFF